MDAKIVASNPAGVAERWREQYFQGGEWLRHKPWAAAVYEQLCDLGERPTAEQVATVVGNKSWSYLSCDVTGEYVESAIQIGTEFGGAGVTVSRKGLHQCLALLNAARDGQGGDA